MQKYIKRLLVALAISASCFWGTTFWFNSQAISTNHSANKVPIAKLSFNLNEVQRKPISRVIWEEISKDEELYVGESIRTTENSEAKIAFLKTGTTLELEPDSQVVLEENENGFTLDLLKGHLLVKSDKKGSPKGLTLKSGTSEIAVGNANLSLSKSEKGNVDLQVFGGVAKLIQKNGKETSLDKTNSGTLTEKGLKEAENKLKVLSPTLGEPIYIDPRTKESITFKWQKLPPGYLVYFEGGKTRNKLRRIGRAAKGEVGSLQLNLKVGKIFWRLVAVSQNPTQNEKSSLVAKTEILPKVAPTPIEPFKDQNIVLNQNEPTVTYKWVSSLNYENYYLEVATDPKLKNKVLVKSFSGASNSYVAAMKKPGRYFWRVTGFMPIKGRPVPVSSLVQSFDLQGGIQLLAPTLKSPQNKHTYTMNDIHEEGIFLTWAPVTGIKSYQVAIKKLGANTKVAHKKVTASMAKLKKLKPGQYEWYVQSIHTQSKKLSPPSEKFTFTIDDLPQIQWVNGPQKSDFYYFSQKPYLQAEWLDLPNSSLIKSWRVRYAKSGELTDDIPWEITQTKVLKKWIAADGEYDIQVEALNSKGKPLAKSNIKTINVIKKPLLPAPQFSAELPEQLKANRRGDFSLNWSPINGAENYKVLVYGEDGNVIKQTQVTENQASITRLKPGNYKVSVLAVDRHKRDGIKSTNKDLTVPKKSNIKAPTLKSFKVN